MYACLRMYHMIYSHVSSCYVYKTWRGINIWVFSLHSSAYIGVRSDNFRMDPPIFNGTGDLLAFLDHVHVWATLNLKDMKVKGKRSLLRLDYVM